MSIDPLGDHSGWGAIQTGSSSSQTQQTSEAGDTMSVSTGESVALKDNSVSLLGFYDAINKALNEADRGQKAWETFEATMNKSLFYAALTTALNYDQFYLSANEHVTQVNKAVDDFNAAVDSYNQAAQAYNNGLSEEQAQIDSMNEAISSYNSGTMSQAEFQAAVDSYNSYAAGRNVEVAAYESAREVYNAAVSVFNSSQGDLKDKGEVFNIENYPSASTIDGVRQPLTSITYATTTAISGSDSAVLLAGFIEQLTDEDLGALDDSFQASLGFYRDLIKSIDQNKIFNEYGDFLQKLLLNSLSPVFLYELTTAVFSGSQQSNGGFGAQIGLQDGAMDSLFSRALLESLGGSSGNEVPPRTIKQMQMVGFSIMLNVALESAMGSAFKSLGSDLAKTTTGEPAFALASSAAFTARILEMVRKPDNFKELVTTILSQDPGFANLPESGQHAAIEAFSSTLRLTLLLFTLTNASVAVNAPGLSNQMILSASSELGIPPAFMRSSLDDVLSNRGVAVAAGDTMVQRLVDSGVDVDEAVTMVTEALTATQDAGSNSNIALFSAQLALNLSLAGVDDFSLARSTALEGTVVFALAAEGAIPSVEEATQFPELRQQPGVDATSINLSLLPLKQSLFENKLVNAGLSEVDARRLSADIFVEASLDNAEFISEIKNLDSLLAAVGQQNAGQVAALTAEIARFVDNPVVQQRLAEAVLMNPGSTQSREQLISNLTGSLAAEMSIKDAAAAARAIADATGVQILLDSVRQGDALALSLVPLGLDEATAKRVSELIIPYISQLRPNTISSESWMNGVDLAGLQSIVAGASAQLGITGADVAGALAGALRAPGALDSDLAFQAALITAIVSQADLDSSEVAAAMPAFVLTGFIDVSAVEGFSITEAAVPEQLFKERFIDLMVSSGANHERAALSLADVNFSAFIDTESLVVSLEADLIARGGVSDERAREISDAAVTYAMQQPTSYVSSEDFRSSMKDALYILGVNPQAANALSSTLQTNVFKVEIMQGEIRAEMAASGFASQADQGYVSAAVLNFFAIGQNEINLGHTERAIESRIALALEPGSVLLSAVLATPTLQELINQGEVEV